LGLREQGDRPTLDVLVRYLKPRRLLLILDNCEHVIEPAARAADAILQAAPHVRILTTSREPLRIAAETVYRVPSLPVPTEDRLTHDGALEYGAVALFVERARAADAAFTLTNESVPAVTEICRRLDGIALAIELAAARVRILPPRQLAQKLDERFRLLTDGSRAALPRQQTMRALIDWSYELLSDLEQRLFNSLAIFANGWTLSAVEQVCGLDELDAIESVSSLTDKSLVVAEKGEYPRYRFLESTRAFALEKLVQSGEREVLARRQALWAADLAERASEAWWNAPTSQWSGEFVPELENARAAIGWAFGESEIDLAARVVVGFAPVYNRLGMDVELRTRLEMVLDRIDPNEQPALAARAWEALGSVSVASRKVEAMRHAVELGEASNDPAITATSLAWLAFGLVQVGRAEEARPIIERSLRLCKDSGLTRKSFYVDALNVRAFVARNSGRLEVARESFGESLSLATTLRYDDQAFYVRMNMAELEFQMGDAARALELIENQGRGAVMKRYEVFALLNAAAYRIGLGDLAGAERDAREALRLARGAVSQSTTVAIQHLATIAAGRGNLKRAARLCGYVDDWFRSQGMTREPTEQRTYEILMNLLRTGLSVAEIETLSTEGGQLADDQAVTEALAM
jgi:predicted ATPase